MQNNGSGFSWGDVNSAAKDLAVTSVEKTARYVGDNAGHFSYRYSAAMSPVMVGVLGTQWAINNKATVLKVLGAPKRAHFEKFVGAGRFLGVAGIGLTAYDSGMEQWRADADDGYSGRERLWRATQRGAIVAAFSGTAAYVAASVTAPAVVSGPVGVAAIIAASSGAGWGGAWLGDKFADRRLGRIDE